MKLLITGSNGQLGNELKTVLADDKRFESKFLDRTGLDLSDPELIFDQLVGYEFDILINCAAYTAVDLAEDEPEIAYRVNSQSVGEMARYCAGINRKMIHVSTDYVFGGQGFKPYIEEDEVNPIGVYGKSKRAGEVQFLNSSVSGFLIRTSWVYSNFGKNFFKTIKRISKASEKITVVSDQIGSPTYACDLAWAIVQLLDKISDHPAELLHFSNQGVCSWYDFAHAINHLEQTNCKVLPIPTEQYPTKAKRPNYSVLNKSKIESLLNIEIRHWHDALIDCHVKSSGY